MGFFTIGKRIEKTSMAGVSIEFLHKHGCTVCPLNHIRGNANPQMKPTGVERPLVYMLGDYPREDDDLNGMPFSGMDGDLLHRYISNDWDLEKDFRWNNCVRTRPRPDAKVVPEPVAVECCRPSVIKDIEASKPRAIFGFGPVPLHWALKRTGIGLWTGRRVPIRVGLHPCWFYPMYLPRTLLERRSEYYNSDEEFAFALQMHRALSEVEALPVPDVHTIERATSNIETIDGRNGWDDVERIKKFLLETGTEPVGFDYETKNLRPYNNDSIILSVAIATSHLAMAFALRHREAGWTAQQLTVVEKLLEDFLYEAPCAKISHHLGFELEWSGFTFGREVIRAGDWEDTESQSYILDERPGTHSLEFLCLQHFGISIKSISNTDNKNLFYTPIDTVLRYNAVDAKYHRELFLVQQKMLELEGLTETYERQLRRVPTMALTQLQGIPVDQKTVRAFHKKWTDQRNKVSEKISGLQVTKTFRERKGHNYRPSSVPDVTFMMRKVLGKYDLQKVDEPTLAKVKNPIAKLTLDWRHAQKMLSTYVEPVQEGAEFLFNGELHPTIGVCSTRTARTSASDLNVQNWPKHQNKELRSQLKHKYKKFVAFDYAGIQARNVAMESCDTALVKAFWDWYDIHSDWSLRIARHWSNWGKDTFSHPALNGNTTDAKGRRQIAKNKFVFPSFFGAQPKKLSAYLGIPPNIAEELHTEFWSEFPAIKNWHERIKADYLETGYVTGLSGYRRRAPISPNELINAPIQADEALIVCTSMAALSEQEDKRLQAAMEIHDDLTFIWDKNDIDKLAERVLAEMLKIRWDWENVPLVVEMSIGDDWGSMHEVGVYESLHKGGFTQRKK